jgi:hypothetical protein
MVLLRSVTVTGDRSPSTDRSGQYYNPADDDPLDYSVTSNEAGPRLRSFRGWKRNTGHLDKSRSTKISSRSHVTHTQNSSLNEFILFFI